MLKFIYLTSLILSLAAQAFNSGDVINAEDFNQKFESVNSKLESRGIPYEYTEFTEDQKVSSEQLNQNFNNFKLLVPAINLYIFQKEESINAQKLNQNFSLIDQSIIENFNQRACSFSTGSGTQTFNMETNLWNELCTPSSCISNYHIESQTCLPNTRNCSEALGSGTQQWLGSSYGICTLNSCIPNYHLNNNSCIPNDQSCFIANGIGTQTWTNGSFSPCSIVSCDETFHLESNQCLSNVQSCPVTGGVGSKTWNSTTQSYGSCNLVACNQPGYYPSMDNTSCITTNSIACTNQLDSVGNTIGYGTYNYDGMQWQPCAITSCISDYTLSNGNCSCAGSSCLLTAEIVNSGLDELQDLLRNKGEIISFSKLTPGQIVSPTTLNSNFNLIKPYDGAQQFVTYAANEVMTQSRWDLNVTEAKRIISSKLYYKNCAEIKYFEPSSISNTYYIDVDGFSGATSPFQMYCDMSGTEGAGTVLKLSSNTFAFGSANWTTASEINSANMLNNSYPSGYDAKNQGYYRLNRSYKIVLDTMRDGVVQESLISSFATQNSPQALMTTQSNAFTAIPPYANWKNVFGHDRSSSPVFDRNGSRQGRAIIGCGKSMTFGYQAHDSQNDVNSGLGQNTSYCGGAQNISGGGGHLWSSSGRYSHGGGLVSGVASVPRVQVKEVSRVWALPVTCADAQARKFRNQNNTYSSGNYLIDPDGANFGAAPAIQTCNF